MPEVTKPESRAKMRQGHRADAIAEHAGLAHSLYMSQLTSGSATCSTGWEEQGVGGFLGRGVWVE